HDHVDRAGGEAVHALHGARAVDIAADAIEAGEQTLAILELGHVDAAGQAEVLHAGAARREGPMGDAEVAAIESAGHAAAGEGDVGRDFAVAAAAELRNHRAE